MNSNNNCSCPTGVVGTGCHTAKVATAPFLRKSKSARLLLSFALVFGVMLFVNAIPAFAQNFHGVGIAKQCRTIRDCDSAAECPGAAECTDAVCDTTLPNTTQCDIRVSNQDDFGDTIRIVNSSDTTAGVTNTPLPIVSVSGATNCVVGAFVACNIGVGGVVVFRDSGVNPIVGDPNVVNGQLPDTATIRIQDLCDSPTTTGCSTSENNVNFSAASTVVPSCSTAPKPDSTACADTDNNDCTTAGCDGNGVCEQAHIPLTSTPCDDVTGTECADPGCSNGVCVADHFPKDSSTACADTDNNECTTAGCNGTGACDQAHIPLTSTPCNDVTGTECADPGCSNGVCVADHFPKDSSTACADTDNNDCTTAGCNGTGACDQAHIPLTSTPCDDVTGTECADPGCSNGVCVADHFPKDSSTACTDTDNKECTTAGCDGAGGCDQNHILVPNSTACTDTDQIACTTAGCDGAGNCDQNHIEDCETGQGCTPGFWKANFDKKGANAWPTTNVLLGSVFTIPACLDCSIDFANLTLRQALDLQGGKDACGKAEILLRAAAAAYLNSLSTCVQFELSTGELVAEVNAALAGCDANAIITEATRLDGFNNAGCPLNQQGQCSNP